MDDIIKQIAEAIDDDPEEIDPRRDNSLEAARERVAGAAQRKAKADKYRALKSFDKPAVDTFIPAIAPQRPKPKAPSQDKWLKEQLVAFNLIDTLEDLSRFIKDLDLKARIDSNDLDRIIKQGKALRKAYKTAEANYRTMMPAEDVGPEVTEVKPGERKYDADKIKRTPELMRAWHTYQEAKTNYQEHIRTENKIVDQIKHYLTAGENDLSLALQRQYKLINPDTDEAEKEQKTDVWVTMAVRWNPTFTKKESAEKAALGLIRDKATQFLNEIDLKRASIKESGEESIVWDIPVSPRMSEYIENNEIRWSTLLDPKKRESFVEVVFGDNELDLQTAADIRSGRATHAGGQLYASQRQADGTKFKINKIWKDYFSENPNEYVFIAYSGLGGTRNIRQIKLREFHERMLDRRLPNLELSVELDEQDIKLLNNTTSSQFRNPADLKTWLETSETEFLNLVDNAQDAGDLEAAIDRWSDLRIQFEEYDENDSDHLADMKETAKDLFDKYITAYIETTDNMIKHVEDVEDVDKAEILKLAQKPIMTAVIIPGAPPKFKISVDNEDKYSTSTLEFYTMKGKPEKSYKVLDPWPVGWQYPAQKLKCIYNDEGQTIEDEFTPIEIYTMDLPSILSNFRILGSEEQVQKIEAGGDDNYLPELIKRDEKTGKIKPEESLFIPQSGIEFYSNKPDYEPGNELNTGNPVMNPWQSFNILEPYERVDFVYQNPVTYEEEMVSGVTRKEIWESNLMMLKGAKIMGLTGKSNLVAAIRHEDGMIQYLDKKVVEGSKKRAAAGKQSRLTKLYQLPDEGQYLDDNGGYQVGLMSDVMQGLEKSGGKLRYQNLIPPGGHWTESEQIKKSLKWAAARTSTEATRNYSQVDRDYSRKYTLALELDHNGEMLPDELSDLRDDSTNKLKSWLTNGYLETPYNDRLKIKTYGVYQTVDFPVRKAGTEERDVYQNMPLRRAAELVDRLWFDYNFKAGSIMIPTDSGMLMLPVVTDPNGFKSVNYPVASGSGRIILSLQKALAKRDADLVDLQARNKPNVGRGICYHRMDPTKRSEDVKRRLKKKGITDLSICGKAAMHLHYPPTLEGTPGNWTFKPGVPVDPATDGVNQSYKGLCDTHYASNIDLMPDTVRDQMIAWLTDILEGPVEPGAEHLSANPKRTGGVDRLGDLDNYPDQDMIVNEIRQWIIEFMQAWFGDTCWLNVLGEFVAKSELSAGKTEKARGAKIRVLDSMRKLYQDLFAMTASLIAVDATFTDDGVTYQPINPGDEMDLLTAGRWTDESDPEDQGVASGMPWLWHAIQQGLMSKIYNYYLGAWRRRGHDTEGELEGYTTLPFAQLQAGDVRSKNQLRAALRDKKHASNPGPTRIRKNNTVLRRPRGEGYRPPLSNSLELDYNDMISEAREIDNTIRDIGRSML